MSDDVQRAIDSYNSTVQFLLDKKTLHLTVRVNTAEDVEQLLTWAYNKEESPMNSDLLVIGFDTVPVSKVEADLLEKIREIFGAVV